MRQHEFRNLFSDSFSASTLPPYWPIGELTAALVRCHDPVTPLDPQVGETYLRRLGRIADELLKNRDDRRDFPDSFRPVDPFRDREMPAWGGHTTDRDGKWNTDVDTSGLFAYPMAAFARRVALKPALHAQYGDAAIGLITATIETFEAFRPELHLIDSDPHAYFTVPLAYRKLQCGGNEGCKNYRALAGKPLPYNQNLSMMQALAELRAPPTARCIEAPPPRLRIGCGGDGRGTARHREERRLLRRSSSPEDARRRLTVFRVGLPASTTGHRGYGARSIRAGLPGSHPRGACCAQRAPRSRRAKRAAPSPAILRAHRQYLSPQSLAGQLAQREGGRIGRRTAERRVRRLGSVFAVRSLGVETQSRHHRHYVLARGQPRRATALSEIQRNEIPHRVRWPELAHHSRRRRSGRTATGEHP